MGNGYSHYYGYPGYNPFMPYGQPYGGYTLPAQFYGPDPQLVYCPTCNKNQTTKLKYVTGKGSWWCCIISAILGGVFGFLGIIWLIGAINEPENDTTTTNAPYTIKRKGSRAARIAFFSTFVSFCFGICCGCMFGSFCCDWSKDVEHYCSVCDTYIGTHLRDHRRPVVILPPECHKHQIMPNHHK